MPVAPFALLIGSLPASAPMTPIQIFDLSSKRPRRGPGGKQAGENNAHGRSAHEYASRDDQASPVHRLPYHEKQLTAQTVA